MAGGPNLTPEQAARQVVLGNPAVVKPENYRYTYTELDQAVGYVADTGLVVGGPIEQARRGSARATQQIWAIASIRQAVRPGVARRWSPRRSSLRELEPATRRRYERSRLAQAEAEAHGVDLETWYQVAPDLRSFRGKAPERQRQPGESRDRWLGRLVGQTSVFAVYISRRSDLLPVKRKGALSRKSREAHQRYRAGREAA